MFLLKSFKIEWLFLIPFGSFFDVLKELIKVNCFTDFLSGGVDGIKNLLEEMYNNGQIISKIEYNHNF